MNPARSPQRTGTLSIRSHSSSAVAATSGAVVTVETTSTSFITGAGLKKCMPITSAGRDVAAAHSTTGSEDVVVARIAPGLQTSSSAANTARLTSSSSTTASTTRSTSPRSSSRVVPVTRATAASRSSSVSLPRTTPLSSDLAQRRERRRHLRLAAPAHDHVQARLREHLDDAGRHRPVPTTPTRWMSRTATSSGTVPSGVSASATTFELCGPA